MRRGGSVASVSLVNVIDDGAEERADVKDGGAVRLRGFAASADRIARQVQRARPRSRPRLDRVPSAGGNPRTGIARNRPDTEFVCDGKSAGGRQYQLMRVVGEFGGFVAGI